MIRHWENEHELGTDVRDGCSGMYMIVSSFPQ